ncbi:hypothetical protein, partial [Pseudomonas sp. K8]|uniref:hypothetical protein n=1 Tax=Pseudomonas sp. K8 TaxID=212200 RepID=UPI001865C69A
MLAKNVNDNACILDERGVFEFFASKLAPTGVCGGGLFEGGGWAEEFVAALFFGYAQGLEVAINTPLVGASLLAKNVNDNACILDERGVFEFFASKLAPTGVCVWGGLFEGGGWAEEFVAALFFGYAQGLEVALDTPLVGASLLAKNVNDNACILDERGVFEFFASKLAPTGVWVYGCVGGVIRG